MAIIKYIYIIFLSVDVFEFVQAALTPNSDIILKASIWMEKYFNNYCSQPHLGEKEIHLESGIEKIDVWNEYVAAIKFLMVFNRVSHL